MSLIGNDVIVIAIILLSLLFIVIMIIACFAALFLHDVGVLRLLSRLVFRL